MKRPTIGPARWLAREHGARQAIVILFDGDDYAAASYGETSRECAGVKRTLDGIGQQIERGLVPDPRGSR